MKTTTTKPGTRTADRPDYDPNYSDPRAWWKLKLLFNDDPTITELLEKLETMAGKSPDQKCELQM